MRKKSLYDIAMEKKQYNLKKDNIIVTKNKSLLEIFIELIGKVTRITLLMCICIFSTVGITVLINSSLRIQFIETIKGTILL